MKDFNVLALTIKFLWTTNYNTVKGVKHFTTVIQGYQNEQADYFSYWHHPSIQNITAAVILLLQ